MSQQTYVFDAELVGFGGVSRLIAVRDDLTLVDLHYALQSAFGWDDDHLYAFWLGGEFWPAGDGNYTHPCEAGPPDALGHSAAIRLDGLDLAHGRSVAYVFDFEDEWRVRLRVRDVLTSDDSRPSPRLLQSLGAAPPQYRVAEHDAA
jgi:Plasmid pRiA4b ORF-3-like protein